MRWSFRRVPIFSLRGVQYPLEASHSAGFGPDGTLMLTGAAISVSRDVNPLGAAPAT